MFELEFALPSECADRLRGGRADIGLLPVAALLDQDLAIFRGAGIASRGAVRTILLISRKPFDRIETLATDAGSRTSVLLSRIVLANRYGTRPALVSMPPDLGAMLSIADGALVIGDAALRLDPANLRASGYFVADLGQEWWEMTGLPMVFAVWAGKKEVWSLALEDSFAASARYGLGQIAEIARSEHAARGVDYETARAYLAENIVFELGENEYAGMERYLELTRQIGPHEFVSPALASGDRSV